MVPLSREVCSSASWSGTPFYKSSSEAGRAEGPLPPHSPTLMGYTLQPWGPPWGDCRGSAGAGRPGTGPTQQATSIHALDPSSDRAAKSQDALVLSQTPQDHLGITDGTSESEHGDCAPRNQSDPGHTERGAPTSCWGVAVRGSPQSSGLEKVWRQLAAALRDIQGPEGP